MKVLITAFDGWNNSSKILVDKIEKEAKCDKLILINSRVKSLLQFNEQLEKNQYDYIISFGQKPVIKNKVYIETTGRLNQYQNFTDYDYLDIQNYIQSKGYEVKISSNAGTSYCNYIYYYGLDKIKEENIHSKMIFIHIPFTKNIIDIDKMSKLFIDYILSLLDV